MEDHLDKVSETNEYLVRLPVVFCETETEDIGFRMGTIPGPEPPKRSWSIWRSIEEMRSISSWESP